MLEGKIVVVTGGAKGIGKAMTRAFAERGAKLVIQDLLHPTDAVNELKSAGHEAVGVDGDISEQKDVLRMIDVAQDAFGTVDILVNNAGIFSSLTPTPICEINLDDWDRIMAVNARGVFLSCQSAVPIMRKRGSGRIINIASNTPLTGIPNFAHYVASKGAVIAFTRALARELGADNILVNAIAPGYTLSDGVRENAEQMSKLREGANSKRAIKRDQTPNDIIGTALFLAGPDSAFMTGQTLCVDGGTYML